MKDQPTLICTCGSFDRLGVMEVRFFEEASRLGALTVHLWSDATVQRITGRPPQYPEAERLYLLRAIRYISQVTLVSPDQEALLFDALVPTPGVFWAFPPSAEGEIGAARCRQRGLAQRLFAKSELAIESPASLEILPSTGRKKILVTGCYDFFHSGHVRFFEEVSAHGDLYVVVGHDANIRLLKGEGHPLFPQEERRYLAGCTRYVRQALVSTGEGWLDADPEVQRIRPDIYAVNEDGDKGGKREYCTKQGIEYMVLRRTPAPGLPRRSSTDLRGF
jgi:cytidyltransferase-like protein